jgi:hypothetical protein
VNAPLPCRDCQGEGGPCDACDDGHALCDQPGCDVRAAERIDFADDGGPSDWVLCARHARETRLRTTEGDSP